MRSADSIFVVYDDSSAVPPDVSSVTGVARFGDMLRRRERLSTTVRSLSEQAGMGRMLHVRDADDVTAIGEAVRRHPADMLYFLLPSHLAPTAERDQAILFLSKLRQLSEPVALWRGDEATGACLVDRDGLLAYLAEMAIGERERHLRQWASHRPPVDDALGLADLRELGIALEFLSGSFSARHFNQIAQERYEVVKRSRDRDKIRREYRFFQLLPEDMQPYFLQPYGFEESGDGASYRMRRLFVPDLAVQWVHRAFTPAQFDQLLAHLFHFLAVRPARAVGREAAAAVATTMYVDKVTERVEELLALPAGRDVDATLQAGGVAGGVRSLLDRYTAAYAGRARRRRDGDLRVLHGDLCFSNILYSPSTQALHLIDPRGADTEDEVFGDALYDVAKLSHSVLGGYDFIVAGLFDLVHDDTLRLGLRVEQDADEGLRAQFVDALVREGYSVEAVRLCEVSLFLSMLPLHIDAPKRVTAFALKARDILDELGA